MPSHTHAASSGNQSANHSHTNTAVLDHVHVQTSTFQSGTSGGTFTSGTNVSAPSASSYSTQPAGGHNHTMSENTTNHNHIITVSTVGVSPTNANLPPYYALAYIMKS